MWISINYRCILGAVGERFDIGFLYLHKVNELYMFLKALVLYD